MRNSDIGTFLSLSPAARKIKMSAAHFARLVRAGKIRGVKTQLGMLFDPVELERLRRERETEKQKRKAA